MHAHLTFRRTAGLFALAALVAAAALPASAQRTERVRFERGASEAYPSATLARGASARFLVGAQRGQTLTASVLDDTGVEDCTLQVYAPGRAVRRANAAPSATGERFSLAYWEGRLSRSGDYQVVVTRDGGRGACSVRIAVE